MLRIRHFISFFVAISAYRVLLHCRLPIIHPCPAFVIQPPLLLLSMRATRRIQLHALVTPPGKLHHSKCVARCARCEIGAPTKVLLPAAYALKYEEEYEEDGVTMVRKEKKTRARFEFLDENENKRKPNVRRHAVV